MSEIGWAWYVYILIYFGFMLYCIYISKKEGEKNAFELSVLILLALASLYLFAITAGADIVPDIPYFVFILAVYVLGMTAWDYLGECKEAYPSDLDDDEDEMALTGEDIDQEDSEAEAEKEYDPAISLSKKYSLVTAEEGVLNLDSYRKPVNPEELGKAIGSLFSSKGSTEEVVDALETFNDAMGDEEDDGDEGTGVLEIALIFLFFAPIAFLAWHTILNEGNKYGWW